MSWIDVAWLSMGAASGTLGLIHLSIWMRQRTEPVHVAFACAALGIAWVSGIELMLMHTTSPSLYGEWVRLGHVPVALVVVALIAAVHLHLGVGRLWLGLLAAGLRLLALAVNFLSDGANLNFAAIETLDRVEILGAPLSVGSGPPNPWVFLAPLANAAFLAYLVDAWIVARPRADAARRRRLATVLGSLIAFVTFAATWSAVVSYGVVVAPMQIVSTFVFVIAAMSYDLGTDVIERAGLAGRLASTEARADAGESNMALAASAADLSYWHWEIDADRVLLSDRARDLFGLAEPDTRFADLFARVHPDDREQARVAIERAMQPGNSYDIELRVQRQDGSVRWIVSRGRVEHDSNGRATTMRGVVMDVSARRAAEERMHAIEREVTQQRSELAHLSRVSILSELSGSLAHELNQPLSAIMSNAQAAIRFLDHEPADIVEVRSILADIVDNDSRAGEVIRRLRAMLKKDDARYVRLDLNAVVTDALRLMRNDLINRQVAVVPEFSEPLPPVTGDVVQLQQVLLNLVTNGCDAMAQLDGGRQLKVRTYCDAGVVQVQVTDCGRGIAPDDLERIFEPFVTTKADGMGLGLSVCRAIVDAHGGRLWATSNPDRGATFHCALPALEPA